MATRPLSDRPRRPFWSSLWHALTWGAVAVCLITAGCVAADYKRMQVPGGPVALFCIGLALALVAAVLLSPPVFKRVRPVGRAAGVVGMFASVIVAANEHDQAVAAYSRTPAGQQELAAAKAAAQRATAEARQREAEWAASPEGKAQAAREKRERSLAELASAKQKLEDLTGRLERCFNWGHRLPALEEPLKESLHNPAAFEHVETVLIVPDDDNNNVVMRFRAENGFGAIRTGQVRGQLVAEDCSVRNISEPSVD